MFNEKIYQVLLNKFKEALQAKLEGYYVWKSNEESLKNPIYNFDFKDGQHFIEEIKNLSYPQKTMFLKENLKKQLNLKSDQTYLNFANWIIKKWGGIRKFNDEKSLFALREAILSKKQKEGNVVGFEKISSLSKVATFMDHSKYAVYDSRVAFSLNWLIFTTEGLHKRNKGEMKFFPQPSGLNSDIERHNQKTIFNLKYKTINEDDYYKLEDAYNIYCQLLIETCNYCANSRLPSYKAIASNTTIGSLEMCLFSIAAKDMKNSQKSKYENAGLLITDEIDKKVKITIK